MAEAFSRPPRIGVLPLFRSGNQTIWMSPLYLLGIEAAGGLPAVLPLSERETTWEALCRDYDGFVFTGGQDVDPAIYGQEKLPQCHYQAPYRDNQEAWMLRRLCALDKPVLGICRGLQLMNAVFGGTLYQDLPSQRPSPVGHLQRGPFSLPCHQIAVEPDTLLHRVLGQEHISVNSVHHQAVKRPAPGFVISGRAEDGLTEALELPDRRFFLGIQWHPEFLWQDYRHAQAIWDGLVRACKESR